MRKFRVWDEVNGEESEAVEVEATSITRAAIEYAAADHDGWNDGLYGSSGHPVMVRCVDGGTLIRCTVSTEMVPEWRCSGESVES